MKRILYLLLTTCICYSSEAYTYLRFNNPHTGTTNGDATIEELDITIKPKGAYFEYTYDISFSAQGYNLTKDDTLELTFHFDLPEGSAVTNSWLWIGDSLVEAYHLDVYTADATYENIVKRIRRDPSIFKKSYDNQYDYKIYPMLGNEIRTARWTILVPALWDNNEVSVPLPVHFIKASHTPLTDVDITIEASDVWKQPTLRGSSEHVINSRKDGNWFYKLKNKDLETLDHLVFETPMTNGVFAHTYNDGNINYFETVLLPEQIFSNQMERKAYLMLEYNSLATEMTRQQLLAMVNTTLSKKFTETDSIKVFYNGKNKLEQTNWIGLSKQNIASLITTLQANLGSVSSTQKILTTVFDAYQTEKEEFNLLCISSSTEQNDWKQANDLAISLYKLYNKLPTIYSCSYSNTRYENYESYYYYYPYHKNYLLEKLSTITRGRHINYNYNTDYMIDGLLTMANQFDDRYEYLEVYPISKDGFTYSVYQPYGSQTPSTNAPIYIYGKYEGSNELELHISGVTDHEVLYKKITATLASGTKEIKQLWAHSYIQNLESAGYKEIDIDKIIKTALDYQVLSKYTSFLALEPGMEIIEGTPNDRPVFDIVEIFSPSMSVMADSWNPSFEKEGVLKNVASGMNSNDENRVLMKIIPNPAQTETSIAIELNLHPQSIQIFNLSGVLVLESKNINHLSKIDLSTLQSGVYNVKVVCEEIILTQKLIIE